MSALRGITGAVLGAATAGVLLRVRTVSKERGQSIGEVLGDLPGILAEDVTRVADAARQAVGDGRAATEAARIEFDEQVAAGARRTKGNDD